MRIGMLTWRTGQEIDELVDDWVPEPLVPEQTPIEIAEAERVPVIVG
jgi:serine palmitoyltransferase